MLLPVPGPGSRVENLRPLRSRTQGLGILAQLRFLLVIRVFCPGLQRPREGHAKAAGCLEAPHRSAFWFGGILGDSCYRTAGSISGAASLLGLSVPCGWAYLDLQGR